MLSTLLLPGLYTEISPRGGGGGEFGVWTKEGGALGGSSVVSCEVLHSRGAENDTGGGGGGGGGMPPPPLNTALIAY